MVCHVKSFLNGCIAAADNGYLFPAKEKSIARRTARHPKPTELGFAFNPQPFGLSARTNNNGFRLIGGSISALTDKGALTRIHILDMVLDNPCAHVFRLQAH